MDNQEKENPVVVTDRLIKLPITDHGSYSFSGEEIARVTTYSEEKPRWTELVMYRRDNGGYIYQRLGRSDVYHLPTCREIFGRTDMPLAKEPGDYGWPCEKCNPPEEGSDPVFTENDKSYVRIARTPEDVLRTLRERDRRTKEVRLSPLAQQLLRAVADVDEAVKSATQQQMMESGTV